MKVILLNNTPLWIASQAIRNCHDSHNKSDTIHKGDRILHSGLKEQGEHPAEETIIGEKDKALIDRVGNKMKHASTLEHLYYNFQIEGISRAVLQELSRHRIASLTVKSTRYTLKELKDEEPFRSIEADRERVEKYCVLVKNHKVDSAICLALDELRDLVKSGISNDKAKYCLPESYKTSLTWSINARSLINFLSLRSDKSALWEIRDLARAVFEALPDDHKYLFKDCMKD
jgi:thymidylate synthase (FAD)